MTDFRELTNVAPQIVELAAAIREMAGDDDLAFADTLDGETTVIGAARAAVRMILGNEAHADAAKALAQRYGARGRDFEDRAARGRDALAHFMGEIAAKTLALPEATVSLAAGSPKLVGEVDPAALPDNLVRIKREPDKTAIKALLQAGGMFDGYSLSNSAPRLQIRSGKAASE